jgi:hypothetical protein
MQVLTGHNEDSRPPVSKLVGQDPFIGGARQRLFRQVPQLGLFVDKIVDD